jgi:hypothetical protein
MLDTGQTEADDINLQRKITLTPFLATKVKFISPRSGRNHIWVGLRFEFKVSPNRLKLYQDSATETGLRKYDVYANTGSSNSNTQI